MFDICVDYEPWTYGIIKETYDPDLFQRSRIEIEEFVKTNDFSKDLTTIFADFPVCNKDFKEVFPHTTKMCQSLDIYELCNKVSFYFDEKKKFKTSFTVLSINVARNYSHKIHDESSTKYFSLVTYISPDIEKGTYVYKNKNDTSPSAVVDWAPNTSMFFFGINGKTWHSFGADSRHRITINRFIEIER